jgi:hypothetical protein
MKKNVLLAGLALLTVSACHRPYALYQPTPFRSGPPASSFVTQPATPPAAADSIAVPPRLLPPPEAVLLASTQAGPGEVAALPPAGAGFAEPVLRGEGHAPMAGKPTLAEQPKPRKAMPSRQKTLREMLGLKPRPALNWWQKIPWQLKAAGIVILVAMLFAILGVTILAILFGVVGAFLLVRGLKKSFKVRRPWF